MVDISFRFIIEQIEFSSGTIQEVDAINVPNMEVGWLAVRTRPSQGPPQYSIIFIMGI